MKGTVDMSEDLHSNEDKLEQQLDSNRRNKIKNFKLNISEEAMSSLDDLQIEDNTADAEETSGVASRKVDNIILPGSPDDFYKDEKEQEKRRKKALKEEKKRKKKKAKKNGCVFRVVWLVMVILVGIIVGEFLLIGVNDLLGRNRGEEAKVVIKVPKDADIDEIADLLSENGIINNPKFFKLYANVTKASEDFTQGSYEMSNDMDYEAIINYLQSNNNRVDTIELQFNEGMTVLEIADKLSENGVCDKDEFLELCNSDKFDEDFTFLTEDRPKLSDVYYKLEGYLFPDTYEFYQGESASTTIYRFLNNYEAKIYYTKQKIEVDTDSSSETTSSGSSKKTYEKLTIAEQAEKQGMTMNEVMTLASMIQAEAASVEDMYMISSVFHNRLDTLETDGYTAFGENINGTLGSDPTIYYPYKQNTAPDNFVSRYNTYNVKGLPAGPDCNPGMDAIKAALYPEETMYYFFCHKAATDDSDAQPYYATTMADHEYNKTLAGIEE